MKNVTSLVETKTFWAAFLALLAIIANQFHWVSLASFATDPNTVTNILNFVTFAGITCTMLFRSIATTKVISFLPSSSTLPPSSAAKVLPLMFALAIFGGAGFGLGGCSTINTLTSPALSPTQVIVAANAFDVLESSATNYLTLPTCPTATPVCKTAVAVAAIVPSIRAGRTARNTLEAAVNSGGSTPISVSVFATLTASITALQATMAQYTVAK